MYSPIIARALIDAQQTDKLRRAADARRVAGARQAVGTSSAARDGKRRRRLWARARTNAAGAREVA